MILLRRLLGGNQCDLILLRRGISIMKWFKHQSNARNDERVAHLEQLAGLEGYGFYMKLLEVVAESMDDSEKHSVTYPLITWSRTMCIHHHTFKKLISKCEIAGLITIKYHDSNMVGNSPSNPISNSPSNPMGNSPSNPMGNSKVRVEVIIPNLLKYRDNHTKNLQVASKQDKDKDKDKDKEIKENADADAGDKFEFLLPEWIDQDTWKLWLKTRKKKMIPEQMQAQVNKLQKWKDEGLDYSAALAHSAENGYQGLFEPTQKAKPNLSIVETAKPKRYFN